MRMRCVGTHVHDTGRVSAVGGTCAGSIAHAGRGCALTCHGVEQLPGTDEVTRQRRRADQRGVGAHIEGDAMALHLRLHVDGHCRITA